MSVAVKVYTWKDVQEHSTMNNCWVVVNEKVYDVTEFIKEHPGGSEAILKHAATDVTEDYEMHSKDAQTRWKTLQIGQLQLNNDQQNQNNTVKCCIM